MSKVKTFIYGILGGISISIGGCAFLASDSKIVGAIFFVVGLFTICTFGFNLFTGKVCYSLDNKPAYIIDLLIIWVGNLLGCMLAGGVLRMTRFVSFAEKARGMVDGKLSDSLLSVFILAIFCNILIFIAVDGFKNNPHELGKYLSLFFGVTVFIIAGFEHCVANMFYISMAGAWSGTAFVFIIVNTLGNAVGGLLIPVLKKISSADQKPQEPQAGKQYPEKVAFAAPEAPKAPEALKAAAAPAAPEAPKAPAGHTAPTNRDVLMTGSREAVTDRLLLKMAEEKGIVVPEEEIEAETDLQVTGRFQSMKYAAMGGGGIAELLNFDKDAMREETREAVVKELTIDKVLRSIVKEENIEVTPEELQREAERIAKEQNSSMEMIKRFFGDDFSGLAGDVRIKKARDLVYERAVRK